MMRRFAGLFMLACILAPSSRTHAQESSTEKELATLFDESRAALSAHAAAMDRSEFEVEALARSLGGDVAAIFSHVRAHVAYEPYRGVLRGAAGCLRAGAGNAWDRALLVRALLASSGHRVRLARGRLGDAEARRIFDEFLGHDPGYVELDLPYFFESEELGAEREGAVGVLRSRVEARYARLRAALDDALGALGAPQERAGEPDESLLDVIRDHVWVRIERDGGGEPIDIDPSTAGDLPGEALTTASTLLDDVPVEERHIVIIKARYEQLEGEQVAEHSVFEWSGRADELGLVPIIVEVERTEDAVGALSGALGASGDKRTLALRIGGQTVATGSAPVGQARRGGFDALAGALGGGGGATPKTVSVSISVSTTGPGEPAGETRLFLVDRWGAVARAARDVTPLAALPGDGEWVKTLDNSALSIGVTTGAPSPAALQDLVIGATRRKFDGFYFQGGRLYYKGAAAAHLDARLLSHSFDHLLEAFAGLAPGFSYVAEVRITAALLTQAGDRCSVSFDLTRDRPFVVQDGIVADQRCRFERGLLGAIVEEELTGDPFLEGSSVAYGAARALEAGLPHGRPRIIQSTAELPPSLTSAARARMEQAVTRGLVVLPARDPESVPWTWFELDSKTGVLTAIAESGLHPGMTEYQVSNKATATRAGAASRIMNTVRGTVRCMIRNVDTLVFLAIDAGTGGLDLASAKDAAQGIAVCLGYLKGKPTRHRPHPPRRTRTPPHDNRHIRDRHTGNHPDFPTKSTWNSPADWRRAQRASIAKPDRVWRQPDGRWRYEKRFDKPVGRDEHGNPCHYVRTVVRPDGTVTTSFPATSWWGP